LKPLIVIKAVSKIKKGIIYAPGLTGTACNLYTVYQMKLSIVFQEVCRV